MIKLGIVGKGADPSPAVSSYRTYKLISFQQMEILDSGIFPGFGRSVQIPMIR